ncbi:hypothetical protein HAX54_022310 [Datura stramonium]|uniref:Uncharacterized protein n=1 Tax=Datura stramonium TaxID=4076 RepID=A0ABS8UWE9_DATST|nr:hypothetical protein [Datura stramonium]
MAEDGKIRQWKEISINLHAAIGGMEWENAVVVGGRLRLRRKKNRRRTLAGEEDAKGEDECGEASLKHQVKHISLLKKVWEYFTLVETSIFTYSFSVLDEVLVKATNSLTRPGEVLDRNRVVGRDGKNDDKSTRKYSQGSRTSMSTRLKVSGTSSWRREWRIEDLVLGLLPPALILLPQPIFLWLSTNG